MAHLWQEDARLSWRPVSLEPAVTSLDSLLGRRQTDSDNPSEHTGAFLCRCGPGGNQWALMAPAGTAIRINGQAVPLGLRVLQDRDELVFAPADGETVHAFFSTEKLAAVGDFAGSESPVICPRCKQTIKPKMPSVRCPDCGAWHHQISEGHPEHSARECWTYSERCALCPQPTELGVGYRWTPEAL